ncbi:MAG: PQQ-binding-like beta-propeller repeat protein [Bdellovibrionota bacterium]
MLLTLTLSFNLLAFSAEIYVDPSTVGKPWKSANAVCQFRGNPTRSCSGLGPIPTDLEIQWRKGSYSSFYYGKTWGGSGWTGQPAVWPSLNSDEKIDSSYAALENASKYEVVVGTYDKKVHFFRWYDGVETRPAFPTGGIIKTSVTLDPDGFPLMYFGSTDDNLRILALDRSDNLVKGYEQPAAKELWKFNASDVSGPLNGRSRDWDSTANIINDYWIQGGENGWILVFKLNRSYDEKGLVQVKPEKILEMPLFNKELVKKMGDVNSSIESSPAVYKNFLYVANSSGRVVGLDLSRIDAKTRTAPIVYDIWLGDDVDTSVVVDEEGMLYLGQEQERCNKSYVAACKRQKEVGDIVKLDPSKVGDDSIVWRFSTKEKLGVSYNSDGGIFATLSMYKGFVYTTTHSGHLVALDKKTGEMTFSDNKIGYHAWGSSVVSEGRLLVPTTVPGGFRIYDLVEDPAHPKLIDVYKLPTEGAIESTPLVFGGRIVVGSRDGYIYSFGGKL